MLSLSTWQLLTQPLIDVSRHAHHAFGGRARTRMQITCPQPTDRPPASGRPTPSYTSGTLRGRFGAVKNYDDLLPSDEKCFHFKIDERWGQFASNTLRKLRHVGAIVFREMSSSFQQLHHLFRAHRMIGPPILSTEMLVVQV